MMNSRSTIQTQTPPIFLDIEASGLGKNSYPIEIGISITPQQQQCYFIKPLPEWTHWDTQAEQIHGIAQHRLQQEGQAPAHVARLLNQQLQGKTVYSDAWGMDYVWLARLFDAVDQLPQFRLESVHYLLTEQQMEGWDEMKQRVIQRTGLVRHRACADALILQQTYLWLHEATHNRFSCLEPIPAPFAVAAA
jgi:hypothetical protein